MKKAIFLDRDGVLNAAVMINGIPTPPRNLEEVVLLPGAFEAINLLRRKSFEIVVVTNQPDFSRGNASMSEILEINNYLRTQLNIQHFYTCFHDDFHNCDCRKPKPGLLKKAAAELDVDLQSSYMIGDRWRDIEAGQVAKCQCFFLDYGYHEKFPDLPFTQVSSLIEAAHLILEAIK
jgi:D-glycero-D-manno-heptose 1,7-bisphosphate phosphatase